MDKWERLNKLRKLQKEYQELYKTKCTNDQEWKTFGSVSVYFEWCIKELANLYRKIEKIEEKLDDAEEELQTERIMQTQFDVLRKEE